MTNSVMHLKEKLNRLNSNLVPPPRPWESLSFQVKHLIKELIKHEVGSVCKFDKTFASSTDHITANCWLFRHGVKKAFLTNRKNCEWGAITLSIRSTYKLNEKELFKAYRSTIIQDVLDLEKSDLYASKIPLKFKAKLPDELLNIQKNITVVNDYTSTNDINSKSVPEETEVPPESIVIKPVVQLEPEAQPVTENNQVQTLDGGLIINFEHVVNKDIYTTIHTLNAMNLLTSDLIQSLNERIKEQIIDTNIVQAILDNVK